MSFIHGDGLHDVIITGQNQHNSSLYLILAAQQMFVDAYKTFPLFSLSSFQPAASYSGFDITI